MKKKIIDEKSSAAALVSSGKQPTEGRTHVSAPESLSSAWKHAKTKIIVHNNWAAKNYVHFK